MKITKQQLKQIIKEELSKVMNESMPGMEPWGAKDREKLLAPSKGEDPDKRAAAIQDGRDDFHQVDGISNRKEKWEGTRYNEYYEDAYYNAQEEANRGRGMD